MESLLLNEDKVIKDVDLINSRTSVVNMIKYNIRITALFNSSDM